MPTGKFTPLACGKNLTRYCFSWSGFHGFFWKKTLPFSIHRTQKSIFLHPSSSPDLWLQQSSPAVHCLPPGVAEARRKERVSAPSQLSNASGNNSPRVTSLSRPQFPPMTPPLLLLLYPCLAAQVLRVPRCARSSWGRARCGQPPSHPKPTGPLLGASLRAGTGPRARG